MECKECDALICSHCVQNYKSKCPNCTAEREDIFDDQINKHVNNQL